MLNIKVAQELKLSNLLSLRKKMTQEKVQEKMINIGEFLNQEKLKKAEPVVTATFQVEMNNAQPTMDMEILVPVDREIEFNSTSEYKFKLVNAVYARYVRNPMLLQNTYNGRMNHINVNNLQPITAAYNVDIFNLKKWTSIK